MRHFGHQLSIRGRRFNDVLTVLGGLREPISPATSSQLDRSSWLDHRLALLSNFLVPKTSIDQRERNIAFEVDRGGSTYEAALAIRPIITSSES